MNKKRFVEILILSLLGAIVILPGFFFWDIAGHELYHSYKNKEYAEKICINYNYPYASHTVVSFPDAEARENYNVQLEDKEERIANRVGRTAAILYMIIALLTFTWAISFIKKLDRKR
ncbi:hypothetical protein CL617_05325 [archaeon]|nr:hypothetical protein [archaeon]|tara:strand:- start:55 stop:408 length:354 start_codon:yes stop_codon:yes gene_type:complete